MKKLICFITLLALFAFTAMAFAFSTGGEFATDMYGKGSGLTRFTGDFAPRSATTVTLGTKGVANISLDGVHSYKIFFTNVSDGALTAGLMKLGGITVWNETGTNPVTTAGDRYVKGKGVNTLGFSVFSSATAKKVTYLIQ